MGLLKTVARAAVVSGTASAVHGRVARRQDEKFADRDAQIASNRGKGWSEGAQAAAPPPSQAAPRPAQPGRVEQLKQLAELKQQGMLTEDEFAAEKSRILSS